MIRRREFITLLGGAGGVAVCGPRAAGRAYAADRRWFQGERTMTARVLPLMLIILTLGLGTVQAEAIDIVDSTTTAAGVDSTTEL